MRDYDLDIFRGLAILAVILLHVFFLSDAFLKVEWAVPIAARLSTGVQLFFVLSGFLMCRSYTRLQNQQNGLLVYAVKRVAKIYPLYLIFMAIGAALWAAAYYLTGEPQPFRNSTSPSDFTARSFLLHVFLLQGIFPQGLHSFVDGSWSIVCEVYFYILLPLVIIPLTPNLAAALVLLAAAIIGSSYAVNELPWHLSPVPGWRYYSFISQLPCFIVGCVLFHAQRNKAIVDFVRRHARVLVTGTIAAMVAMIWFNHAWIMYHHVYAALFGVLILAALTKGIEVGTLPFGENLARMGEQSYALFLVHIPLLGIERLVLLRLGVTGAFEQVFLMFAGGLFLSLWVSDRIVHRWDTYFVAQGNILLNQRITKIA